MNPDELEFLKQLTKSLQDAEVKLEKAYSEGNSETFNSTKKLMLQIQGQIKEAMK